MKVWKLVVYLSIPTLWLVFFFPILKGSTMFDDTIEQFYPAFHFLVLNLRNFSLPFFNHHQFAGFPFLNEPQYFALNPFFILRHIVGILNDSLHTYNIMVAMNYLFGFVFSFLYLKRKFEESIALFGAIIYTFSMNHITTIVHPHVFDLIPLVPLIFYLLETSPFISAIFMGISFHTGHPQKPLYLLLSVIIYYLLLSIKDRKRFVEFVAYIFVVVPFILAYYFQAKDLFGFSERVEWDIKSLLESSYHLDKFVSLLIPKFYGSIEEGSVYVGGPYHFYMQMSIYFSIVGLVMAIFAVIKHWKDFYVKFSTIVILVMIFLALGDQNPIINFVYSTGLVKGLRDPVRALHITPIFVSILASYGLKSFMESKDAKRILKILGVLIFIAILYMFSFNKPYNFDNSGEILKFFLLALSVYILSFALTRGLSGGIFIISIIILTFLDLYSAGNPYLRRNLDVENYYNPEYINDIKPPQLGYYRINARFNKGLALPRNSGMINGLELVDGYEPLISRYYIGFYRYMISREEGFDKLLSAANVRYYIGERGFNELKNTLPRTCIYYDAKVLRDSSEFFGSLRDYDVHRSLYLQDSLRRVYDDPSPCKPASILNYDYKHVRFSYESDKPGVLYISIPVYPYWEVNVNGKKGRILRANWAFMAVEILPGRGIVEVSYNARDIIITVSLWMLGVIFGFLMKFGYQLYNTRLWSR